MIIWIVAGAAVWAGLCAYAVAFVHGGCGLPTPPTTEAAGSEQTQAGDGDNYERRIKDIEDVLVTSANDPSLGFGIRFPDGVSVTGSVAGGSVWHDG